MKGYLKTDPRLIQLEAKVTTIGKDGCNIVIQGSSSLNQKHALIEYRHETECFVLEDLNSGQGSYINDKRLDNGSYQLEMGDILRFGDSPQMFELVVKHEDPKDKDKTPRYPENRVIYHRTVFPETSPLEINVGHSFGCHNPGGSPPISRSLSRSRKVKKGSMSNRCRYSMADSDDSEPSDTELVCGINKLVYGRRQRKIRMQEMEGLLLTTETITRDLEQLKTHLSDTLTYIAINGIHSDGLRGKIDTVRSVTGCVQVSGIQKVFIHLLEYQLQWITQLELALRECGIDNETSLKEAPWVHVRSIYDNWCRANQDIKSLNDKLFECEEQNAANQRSAKHDLEQRSDLERSRNEEMARINRERDAEKQNALVEMEGKLKSDHARDIQSSKDRIAALEALNHQLNVEIAIIKEKPRSGTPVQDQCAKSDKECKTEKVKCQEAIDELKKENEGVKKELKKKLKDQKEEFEKKIISLERQLKDKMTRINNQQKGIKSLKLSISETERGRTDQEDINRRKLQDVVNELRKKNDLLAELKADLSYTHQKLSIVLSQNDGKVCQNISCRCPCCAGTDADPRPSSSCSLPRVCTPHPPQAVRRVNIRIRR